MKRQQLLIIWGVGLTTLILVFGLFLYYRSHQAENFDLNRPKAEQPSIAGLYYPMTNFDSRITFRSFGQLVKPTDSVSPCGAPFSGYHNADDLEVTASEVNGQVPVYAISDSKVSQIGIVSGYGGLLVLSTEINNQNYTVYYGHIDLGSTTIKLGDNVKAGEKIANLSAQCSSQAAGERKHLHFAMHLGTTIDVRGYVADANELSAWIDPKAFFDKNQAKNP